MYGSDPFPVVQYIKKQGHREHLFKLQSRHLSTSIRNILSKEIILATSSNFIDGEIAAGMMFLMTQDEAEGFFLHRTDRDLSA
jgi:hypothetical protein